MVQKCMAHFKRAIIPFILIYHIRIYLLLFIIIGILKIPLINQSLKLFCPIPNGAKIFARCDPLHAEERTVRKFGAPCSAERPKIR